MCFKFLTEVYNSSRLSPICFEWKEMAKPQDQAYTDLHLGKDEDDVPDHGRLWRGSGKLHRGKHCRQGSGGHQGNIR